MYKKAAGSSAIHAGFFLCALIHLFLFFGVLTTASGDIIGHWKFDEASGTVAADSSSTGNNGALQGGVAWTPGKNATSALLFDGVDDRVRISSISAYNVTGDFSIDLWIKPSAWTKGENVVSNGLFRVYHRGEWAGDRLYFLMKINSAAYPGDSAWSYWGGVCTQQQLNTDNWYHLACVKSGTTMSIYLNGIKEKEIDALSGYTLDTAALNALFIGGDGRYFNGNIDEVRLWDNALSSGTIAGLYAYPPLFPVIGDMSVYEKTCLRFTVQNTQDGVTHAVAGLPSGASFTPLPASEIFGPYVSGYLFSWTPSPAQTGVHNLTVSAARAGETFNENIDITVKESSILRGAKPGLVCRGDGEWEEKVRRNYGADANQTGNPLGGGTGYTDVMDSARAAFTVNTKNGLKSALAGATSGHVVYVADDAEIDMTGEEDIVIPAGVTLASGRGKNNSPGALIFSERIETFPLFIAGGAHVRVTGLRLRGPDQERRTEQMRWLGTFVPSRYYDIPNSRGIQTSHSFMTVDNCELYGWSHAAVLISSGENHHIHHNYIHHNQRQGLGYGVCIGYGGSALIEANVFDWNRHSIAGGRDFPVNSYEARYNLVLGNANGHYFDMHGGNDIGNPAVPAGGYLRIHHNTFHSSNQYAVGIRGVPSEGAWVYSNWALYDTATMTSDEIFYQILANLPGHTAYEKMWVTDNWFGAAPPPSTNAGPSLVTPANRTVIIEERLTFTVSAEDPDPDTLVFSAADLPAGASFDPAARTFDWTPTAAQVGTYIVRFQVSDGELSDHLDVTILVRAPPENISEVIVFPNPCHFNRDGYVRIAHIPAGEADAAVSLYSITGELVRTLKEPYDITLEVNQKTARWDGRNEWGNKVASGIYIYMLKGRTGKKTGKIAVFW